MALPLAQRQPMLPFDGDMPLTRGDIVDRYLHLREISKKLHDGALNFISDDALLNCARRLGLAQGKTLLLDDADEIYYIYDLAVYTAPPDRSRAIDRYAKSARFVAQSDERLMLDAMLGSPVCNPANRPPARRGRPYRHRHSAQLEGMADGRGA